MLNHWLLATLHLLALPLGLGALWARRRALILVRDAKDLSRVFSADNLWGAAAILWIATGLIRVFGGIEKGSAYYLHNPVFFLKMGLLVAILALEVRPMMVLIRWRIRARRQASIDVSVAPALARTCTLQAMLVVLMVCAATALARGYFY